MTERKKRIEQLEKLKSGIFPGIFVVEKLNSAFSVSQKWEYETQEEAEEKFYSLRNSGIYPAFLNCYVKFTF